MSKYRNKKTVVDGITFDSKKEAARYLVLKSLQRSGVLTELILQPEFLLCPSVMLDGKQQRPVRYRADFSYKIDGMVMVEDCKGFRTPEYRIKRKLMRHVHGVEVIES